VIVRAFILILASGLILALASSAIPREAWAVHSEIMGCETGCAVAAVGWPIPYVVDYPGISVVGRASVTGALVGEDQFRLSAFGLTFLFWTAVAALVLGLLRSAFWRRMRPRSRSRP
jgi:hypothetical protein